jgi:hypothetical protein
MSVFSTGTIAENPAAPFLPLEGEWQGHFYVYSPDGTLVRILEAHHIYKQIDKNTVEGTQKVKYPDGTIENVRTRDYVENGKLYCHVESDRFGTKLLNGRFDGSQIFWSRQDSQTLETFRERVIDGKIYAIDGYGIYGKDISKVYTYFAEYKRVK